METITCTKCRGDGIIGNGPEPWAKQGATGTCPDCVGTGKVEQALPPAESSEPATSESTDDGEKKSEDDNSETDNTDTNTETDNGIETAPAE